MTPPAAVAVLDDLVEHESDDAPGRVVDGGRRRDHAGPAEDERHVDVAELALGEHAGQQVEDGRAQGAGDEKVHEPVVDLAGAEDALRADQTPDDGSVEEDATAGAGVVVDLLRVADVGDGAKGPVQHGDLHDAGPHGGDDLAGEERPGRDLDVVTHLQVGGEGERLRHGDVAVRLEHHHREGPPGLHVPDDELGDDVEAQLDVGDGLDHADGDAEDAGDDQGDDERPPGEVGVPRKGGGEREAEHDEEGDGVPPPGSLGILAHHLCVHVGFFAEGQPGAHPDLLAVEEDGVGDQGEDGGEGETVRQGKGGGEEEGRVLLVGVQVELELGRQDARHVVHVARVVVAAAGGHWQVGAEAPVAVVQTGGRDHEEENDADERVGDGVPREHQGREGEAGDLGPVEGDGDQTESAGVPEQLVDDDVVGCDPGGESKVRKRLEDPAREEVPAEGAAENDQEVPVTTDAPSVRLARVGRGVVVEGVEERGVDQVGGPDHGCGPYQELAEQASETVAEHLRGKGEEKLEPPAKVVAVETLHGNDGVGRIRCAPSPRVRDVGHDGYQRVLLHVEFSGAQELWHDKIP